MLFRQKHGQQSPLLVVCDWSQVFQVIALSFESDSSLYKQEGQERDDKALQENAEDYEKSILSDKAGDHKYIWDFFADRFTCVEGLERTPLSPMLWDGGQCES